MRYSIYFCLLSLLCIAMRQGQAQTYSTHIDSLIQTLGTNLPDTTRVEILGELASEMRRVDLKKAEEFGLEALHLAEQKQLESGQMRTLYMLGVIYRQQGDYDKAMASNQKSLQIAQAAGNQKIIGANANSIGNILQGQGNYEQAIRYFLQALEAYGMAGHTLGVALVYNNMGLVFKSQENYPQAKRYFLDAIKAYEEAGVDSQIAQVYMNLGNVEENDSLAFNFFDKALQIHIDHQSLQGIASVRISRGSKMIDQKKFEQALSDYLPALEIVTQSGHKDRIATAKSALGKIYFHLNDYPKAIQFAKEAAQLASEMGFRLEAAETYGLLADIYAKSNQYEQAYHYLSQQKTVMDSLLNEKSLEITSELEAKYQSQKQQTDLAQEKLETARQKNMRNRNAIISLVLLLGLLFASAWIYRSRQQKALTEVALQLKNQEAQQLKELDQLKSSFFANISHEFRTPLTLIISPLEQLLKKEDNPLFKTMLRSGRQLLQLVNELLDLSKLESGKMQLNAQPAELIQWVRPLVYAFESLAIRKQIEYVIELPSEPIPCFFDLKKVEKVLTNLLSNAFKFTPEEGRIFLKIEQNIQGNIRIEVKDSGIGIPLAELDHIFDRFYQIDQSNNPLMDGSGIGLALTRELVKLHQGSIEVSSQLDKGTCFQVILPIVDPKGSIAPMENQPFDSRLNLSDNPIINKPSPGIHSDKPLILIVEDNADLRTYIHSCFTDNWIVEEAFNGVDGLEKAIELIPEVIITDVMMPKMDGYDLTKALRTNTQTSHIPIIMLTAKAFVEDRIQGFEYGADHYLTKPFDAGELVARTISLIEQRQRLREKYIGALPQYLQNKDEHSSQEEKFIQRLVDVVRQNMEDEEFGVEELSAKIHLSRYQLHRKIKALTGKSISVFIRSIRLAHARQLLEAKSGNVSEIAFQLGFNSVAYFSKCFTEEFGFPPSKLL